jgi:endonuclease/exonuclease/phosphatase family metal-dependent hydrolase
LRTRTRSTSRVSPLIVAAGLAAALALSAGPAWALKVVTYNLLNFPGTTGSERVADFRVIMSEIDPDVIIVQEMLSQSGVNMFLLNVLDVVAPGAYAAGPFVDGPDTDNAIFYKTALVDLISHQEIATDLRNISEYVLRPDGYASSAAEFRVYSFHLKAGTSSSDQSERLAETTILRNHLNALPAGSLFMLGGDYNIQSSDETAYQKLVGSLADNDGRSKDPIDRPGTWHDNASFADIHSQSTRTTSFGGGATGGMDDRFDILLASYALADGEGMDYVTGTYEAFGNDGQHFNEAINDGTNYAVGAVVADALHAASDHLPVVAEFCLPAKIDAASSLSFGTAIVGASVGRDLEIDNIAPAPAADLVYSFSAPAGFSAPSGSFDLASGASDVHAVTMNTSSAGGRSGTLVVSSNDLDHPAWNVALSGSVLGHAVPSLSGTSPALAETLDFGSHPAGDFADETARIWDLGYSASQALLAVTSAEIAGGGGRFSFVDGFSPATIGDTSADYAIAFDADGAADSLFTATVTFHTGDGGGLPGATALDDLTVVLRAQVESGSGVPGGGPSGPALGLASRNPFPDQAALSLTLPAPASAEVVVYDVRGRVVAVLASGVLPAGETRLVWNGRDRTGRAVSSGVYFVRASAGSWSDSKKLLVLR